MRDPNRIPIVLETLRRVWTQYPDLRLCQLLVNVEAGDPYYTEDDKLVADLEAYPAGWQAVCPCAPPGDCYHTEYDYGCSWNEPDGCQPGCCHGKEVS